MSVKATGLQPGHGDALRVDVAGIRAMFPILGTQVHGRPLVYLDNAATMQKPMQVIEAVEHYYTRSCSNVHRGVHELSARATADFEGARESVREMIGAAESREIIFTRGTTESINLVARTLGDRDIRDGDEVLLTQMEHHSNIVPWQLLAERTGARLQVVPMDERGELMLDRYEALLGPRTKLVAVVHTSNALGTRNPVETMVALAHSRGVPVLIDGAQAVAHERVDVQALGCDFFCFSGHKMFGPTGIGVLYGKAALLEALPPFQGGGEMIQTVTFEGSTWKGLPHRFEAGTPDIAGAIGLGAAAEFVQRVGADVIAAAEHELLEYGTARLSEIPGLRIIGTASRKAGIISFVVEGIHPHDLGTVLDREGIAVRAGHHCAQPVMAHFGVPATVRASFAIYNTRDEIDALVVAIHGAIRLFA